MRREHCTVAVRRVLYFVYFRYLRTSLFLVARWPRECVDERAGTRTVGKRLKSSVKIKDIRRCEAAAGAVNREHGVAVDFVEVDVFQHGASPMRQVQEVDASLIGVDAGFNRHAAHGFAAGEEQIQIVAVFPAAFLDDLADGDAQIFPGMFLFDGHVRDELAHVIDAESFAHFVDGQANVGRRKRGVAGVDSRRGQLHRVRGAIQIEPGAGGRVVLVIFDAEERDRLRAAQAVVHDHVAVGKAGGIHVDRDGLRGADGIGGDHVGGAAIGGQRRIVDLDRLADVDERRAWRRGHGPRGARERADRTEHTVTAGLHQLVEKRAELLHAVGHFAFGGIFDGAFAAGGRVLHQLGDFNREAEENRRDLRDVIRRAGTAPEIAAVRVVRTGFASGIDLQWQTHVAARDFLDVAALLDNGEQNIVALVEQGHFVAHLLELQRDDIRVCLCWHLCFSLDDCVPQERRVHYAHYAWA